MRAAAAISPVPGKLTFDLLTLKSVSESRDVGYLCANFSFPRPLCSRLRPDVRDRQTSDVRHASSLNASALWRGHNNPHDEGHVSSGPTTLPNSRVAATSWASSLSCFGVPRGMM